MTYWWSKFHVEKIFRVSLDPYGLILWPESQNWTLYGPWHLNQPSSSQKHFNSLLHDLSNTHQNRNLYLTPSEDLPLILCIVFHILVKSIKWKFQVTRRQGSFELRKSKVKSPVCGSNEPEFSQITINQIYSWCYLSISF